MVASEIYVDQSATELRLTACTGVVDTRQFNVLESGKINSQDWVLEFGIIGGSHFFILYGPENTILSEVFACTTVDPCGRILFQGDPRGSANMTFPIQKLVYSFQYHLITNWEIADQVIREMESGASGKSDRLVLLAHDFPHNPEDTRVPKTIVEARADSLGLKIRTIHSYPQEDMLVQTISRVNL
ncbi:MAG: DUF2617 family protein [Candidatus Pacebacteria bacterium]|nr:DUF2617 family protein [Candidatus Paceibacterota bacterium]